MLVLGKNFSRCSYAVYLHGVIGRMSNPQCSAYVSISGASGNERTSRSYTENVAYHRTLTYGTRASFLSLY